MNAASSHPVSTVMPKPRKAVSRRPTTPKNTRRREGSSGDEATIISARIGEIFESSGRTVADISASLGVNDKHLGRWKRDKLPMQLVSLARLCRELGVSSDYVLGLTDSDAAIVQPESAVADDEFLEALEGAESIDDLEEFEFGEGFYPVIYIPGRFRVVDEAEAARIRALAKARLEELKEPVSKRRRRSRKEDSI